MLLCGNDTQNGRNYYKLPVTSTGYTPQWPWYLETAFVRQWRWHERRNLYLERRAPECRRDLGPTKQDILTIRERTHNCLVPWDIAPDFEMWVKNLVASSSLTPKKGKPKREMQETSERLQPIVDVTDYVNPNWRARSRLALRL